MNIFPDADLDQRAQRIKTKIDEISQPMGAMGAAMAGHQVNLANPEAAAKMMQDIHENGLRIAKEFLNSTLPDLSYIKGKVGSHDETYLDISDAIAITASAVVKMPISSANMFAMASDFHSDKSLVSKTKSDLAEGTRLMSLISNLEMSSEARQVVNQTINMINVAEKRASPKSGCFIATCVYGSYNAKEVMILRSFRDSVLNKSKFGRKLVNIYYYFSPKLVSVTGDNAYMKKASKLILNILINRIK